METIKFEIRGIEDCPLKMDKYVDGLQPKTDDEYIKQAEKKVYLDDEGYLCVEAGALKACLKEAAIELAGNKKGKAMRQIIMAQLFIKPVHLRIQPERKNHDGIDKVMVSRKMGTKITRVPSYRPLIKNWSVSGTISVFGLSEDFVKQALELAGLKYGLYGHRPEFGRFDVVSFG